MILTLNAASSAPTCRDYIVEILTILISNEQLWEFRYSLGNRKLIIWSKNNLKFAYGIYKKIITINPPWNSFQNHASGNTNTLPSHGTNNTKICSSLPPSHSIWGWRNRGLYFHFHLIINIGINIYIIIFIIPNWQWRFINLIFLYNNYIRQKFKWYFKTFKIYSTRRKNRVQLLGLIWSIIIAYG